jgi:hypothetical protein
MTDDATLFEFRAPGASGRLAEGWVVHPLRWNGRDVDVAYDARRLRVGRICAGPSDEFRQQLVDAGWRHVDTDADDVELWVATTADLARARLASVAARGAGVEQPAAGIR